jgi:hypothetical protein
MKDPIRYGRNGGDLEPLPNGKWVKWEDYAELKAEHDVIHSSKCVYFIHGEGRWANIIEENAALKSEVERLKGEAPLQSSIAEVIRQVHLEVGEMTEVLRLKEQVESLTIVNSLLQEKVRAYQLLKNFKREPQTEEG